MNENNYFRNGQIPPFGNWDYANDLPITQYFECARDAGLLRYSSSSGESELHGRKHGDLYAIPEKKASRTVAGTRKAGTLERRSSQVKEHGKQGTKSDQMDQRVPRKQRPTAYNYKPHNDAVPYPNPHLRTKQPTKSKAKVIGRAVDEDLYKIPPHLLHTTKRKKVMGFFSRCLVPDCKA